VRRIPVVTRMRVLGIDTSLRSTGLGVVDARGSLLTAVEQGRVHNPDALPLSECLCRLDSAVREIIARVHPDAAAIEDIFFAKNARTAMILGEARGVAIAACAASGIPVFEYPPRRVKQAVVGFGGAEKAQVRRMVMALLKLAEEPQEDAGDALAIAICHLNTRSTVAAMAPKSI
jgi:crossover junction endodeoxyribonuclease RuvC